MARVLQPPKRLRRQGGSGRRHTQHRQDAGNLRHLHHVRDKRGKHRSQQLHPNGDIQQKPTDLRDLTVAQIPVRGDNGADAQLGHPPEEPDIDGGRGRDAIVAGHQHPRHNQRADP